MPEAPKSPESALVARLNGLDAVLHQQVDVLPDSVWNTFASELFNLRVELDAALKARNATGKIFVAVSEDGVSVHGTVAVDVIIAQWSEEQKARLVRDKMVPLSEASFLELVHDALAVEIADGSVSIETLNKQ